MKLAPMAFGAKHLATIPLRITENHQAPQTRLGECLLLETPEDCDALQPQLLDWSRRRNQAHQNTLAYFLQLDLAEFQQDLAQHPHTPPVDHWVVMQDAVNQQLLGLMKVVPQRNSLNRCLAAVEKSPDCTTPHRRIENVLSGMFYGYLKRLPLPPKAMVYWSPTPAAIPSYQRLFQKFLGTPLASQKAWQILPNRSLDETRVMALTAPEAKRFIRAFEKHLFSL